MGEFDNRAPTPFRRTVEHGDAALLPDVDQPGGWLLTLDNAPQSYVDTADLTHLEFEYTRRLGHLVDLIAAPAAPIRALHLGGGAFTMPRYIAATRPGSAQRVVELDAGLVDLVRRVLPWEPTDYDVVIGDARDTLSREPAGTADLIIADVFAGAQVPATITSVEFAAAARKALARGGWYAVNIADGAALGFAKSQAATVLAAFGSCCLIAEPTVLRGRRFGNVLLVAPADRLPLQELGRRLAADPFPARLLDHDALRELIGETAPLTDATAVGSPEPPTSPFDSTDPVSRS